MEWASLMQSKGKPPMTAAERAHVEEWRQIPGYGGHYEASSLGKIRVKDRVVVKPHSTTGKLVSCFYRSKILRDNKASKCGHRSVSLGVDGITYSMAVHVLVLLAFVGPRPDGMEACHNNGTAWDNRPSNLRWDTHANNNADRLTHGTYARGAAHHMAKLSEEQVRGVRERKLSNLQIMVELGISRSQAQRIRTGQSWRHI